MKALFFGGAFNPMTNAHLELAKEVKDVFGFEKVIFVPTKSKYILSTEGKEFSFSEKERYEMLLSVKKNHPFMEVSGLELRSECQPRTYFTMKELKKQGYDLTLMIGSDWLKTLKSAWLYVDEILNEFSLLVIQRNHDRMEEIIDNDPYLKERKEHFLLYTPKGNYQDISSSLVRKYYTEHNWDAVKNTVPKEVYSYLEENNHER